MKKILLTLNVLFFIFLVSCSSNIDDPTVQLDDYIKKWEKTDFTAMYKMVSDDTKANYDEEAFIDRYDKIYQDIKANDLAIQYDEVDDKVLKKAKKDEKITIPLKVELDSIGGMIEFTNDITLVLTESDKEDEDPSWLVEWDPSFIYPGLEKDGKLSIQTEEPKRGEIVDKNQMPLALNDVAYEIGVVPDQFADEEAEIAEIARLLDISTDSIDKALSADWIEPEHFIPLKTIPNSAEDRLAQLTALPAVQKRDTTGRNYPAGKAAAHITGYVGPITAEELKEAPEGIYNDNDLIGKVGLEKMYEDTLRGERGAKITLTIPAEEEGQQDEEIVVAEKEAKNGERVQLSLDINIQETMYEAYEKEDVAGTAAAVHPTTGEILALISSPGYDPNELTFGITQSRWDSLMDDPREPFTNRFTSLYAPGSVIKPLTAAIGLTEGSITHDEGLTINGLKWGKESWKGVTVTRVSSSGNPVHLREAMIQSDNIYFAMKSLDIGAKNYVKGLKDIGFEEKIPIALSPRPSHISNSGDLKDEILLANSSYGQGEIEMSSLHLALAYTAFLNDGNIVKPSFLKDDKQGEIWKKDVISKKDAEKMQEYLSEVVTKGTGKAAQDDDLAISGKTGTAELKKSADSSGHQNGWFVGYPTDDPDIVIAMMMEHTENLGTSSFAAKNVKDILKSLD